MKKTINFNKTVYELVKEDPEILEIMANIGFKEITNPVALNSMARVMTIPKGAKIKDIDLNKIIQTFESKGYTVIYDEKSQKPSDKNMETNENSYTNDNIGPSSNKGLSDREIRLKSYIERLNEGEDLEAVRNDFVENFSDVSSNEIVNAEQALIDSGMAISQVQSLCDVHSALFHESDVKNSFVGDSLVNIPGHPLNILYLENQKILELVKALREGLDKNEDPANIIDKINNLRQISRHYSKKDQLISPLLKSKYGVSGPADVMWGVDDEIRSELARLSVSLNEGNFAGSKEDIYAVLDRIKEMIYKEENILFSLSEENFSDREWIDIYFDYPEMGYCFIGDIPKWELAENTRSKVDEANPTYGNTINLPGGQLTIDQLEAILRTLPAELTFIDENDICRFFSDSSPKLFPRPKTALGRDVYSCHPPKSIAVVKSLIDDFKSGKKDDFVVWMKRDGLPIKVKYMAVRNKQGKYLGTLESVEGMKEAEDYFSHASK